MRSPTSDVSYVQASPRLSDKARQAMDDATAADAPLMISTVAVVELVYHMEKAPSRKRMVKRSTKEITSR